MRQAAISLVREGAAELVAVTMGAYGALLASAGGIVRVPAPRVSVRSAIGAGDSFLGAMVWALSNDWGLDEAFRFGAAAGTAKVQTPGTQLCKRDAIDALYRMTPRDAPASIVLPGDPGLTSLQDDRSMSHHPGLSKANRVRAGIVR